MRRFSIGYEYMLHSTGASDIVSLAFSYFGTASS